MDEKKVYTAVEIQKMLNLSKSKLYIFLDEAYRRQDPFKVLKIGKLYRIQKDSFDKWINGEV
ncbi:MAG: helix-turn-helix domain-containing protein [Bacilli bacterium]|nr:helix-turn-helix domain-containing protein [Bacilli bacterium]